jgi:hypothetical protein
MHLLIKLILAHLIGDFLLQSKKWVEAKETKKLAAWQLYIHVLSHVAITALLLWDENEWTILLAIFLSHYIIDASKILLQRPETKRTWFFVDQLLHGVALYLIYYFHTPGAVWPWYYVPTEKLLLLATALFFLTRPASLIIKISISRWTPKSATADDSLEKAGNFIGILERLFVFGFVLSGQWQAIGFLLAAKSVFRFGDLRAGTERKLTEYVLIGTLLSFGLASITGALYNALT